LRSAPLLLLFVIGARASYESRIDSPNTIVSFGTLRAFCGSLLVLTTNDRAVVSRLQPEESV
jgi:hypothetical protein